MNLRFKDAVTIYNGKDYKHIEVDEGYPVMGSGGQFAYASDYLYDGEVILLGRKGTIDRPLYYNGKFWSVDTMYYAVPKNGFNGKFLYYSALTFPYLKYSTATALPSMTKTVLERFPLPYLTLTEQEAIASYLDKECEKIGREIELLERKADGYRRLRRSLINRAVTRGLNPNAPLKPSGNDWIGYIPEHWSVEPLRRFLTLISPKRKGDSDFQLLSVTRDKGVIIRGAKGEDGNNNRIPDDLSDYKIVHCNQFVVNKMKAWMGSYGISQYEGIVSPAYYICDVHNIYEPFLSVAIRCKMYTNFFWKYSKGIRVDQWDMSPLALREIPFVTPPLTEQCEIVEYLDEKCGKIDAIVEKIETKIECLKELKRSLINEVVTGQRAISTK